MGWSFTPSILTALAIGASTLMLASDLSQAQQHRLAGPIVSTSDSHETPPRGRVDSLPPEVQQRYAATGTLRCPGLKDSPHPGVAFYATAQLTLKDNLITVAGHTFLDDKTCRALTEPQNCRFIIHSHGKERRIAISEMVENGNTCSGQFIHDRDWAVLKLSERVDDVRPYDVDEERSRALEVDDLVVTVAHSVDFHSRSRHAYGPKYYSECKILQTFGPSYVAGVRSACGATHGALGGSLLSRGENPILLGIVVPGDKSAPDVIQATARGRKKPSDSPSTTPAEVYPLVPGEAQRDGVPDAIEESAARPEFAHRQFAGRDTNSITLTAGFAAALKRAAGSD